MMIYVKAGDDNKYYKLLYLSKIIIIVSSEKVSNNLLIISLNSLGFNIYNPRSVYHHIYTL